MKTIISLIVFLSISAGAFCQNYYSNTCCGRQKMQYEQRRQPEFQPQNCQQACVYYYNNASQKNARNEKYIAQTNFDEQLYDINCANGYNRVLQNTICKPEYNYQYNTYSENQQTNYLDYNIYTESEPRYYPYRSNVGEKYIDSGQYEESMVYMW